MSWPFPKEKGVNDRLDKRFPPGKQGSIDDATRDAVINALGKKLTTSSDVQVAVEAMRKAITMLESGTADARVEYLRGAADLQISKGSGLLAFTAIITAGAGIGLEKFQADFLALVLCAIGGLFALGASLMSLIVVWSKAPSEEQFADAASESRWLAQLLASRGRKANWAVVHSIVATFVLALSVAVFVWPESKDLPKQEQQTAAPDATKSGDGDIADAAKETKPHQGM
jgi:hypothetical protein